MDNRLNGPTAPSAEVRSLLKGELRAVGEAAADALNRGGTRDETTARHLRDDIDEVATILDPRAMRERTPPAAGAGGRGGGAKTLGTGARPSVRRSALVRRFFFLVCTRFLQYGQVGRLNLLLRL